MSDLVASASEPPGDLDASLRLAGTEVALPGNRPLQLAASAAAWYLIEGRLELFAVEQGGRGGAPTWPPAHPGALLFGGGEDGNPDGIALLAVGATPVRLARLAIDDLRELAREPGGPGGPGGEGRRVDRAAVRGRPERGAAEDLHRAGAGQAGPARRSGGRRPRSARGMIWVRQLSGALPVPRPAEAGRRAGGLPAARLRRHLAGRRRAGEAVHGRHRGADPERQGLGGAPALPLAVPPLPRLELERAAKGEQARLRPAERRSTAGCWTTRNGGWPRCSDSDGAAAAESVKTPGASRRRPPADGRGERARGAGAAARGVGRRRSAPQRLRQICNASRIRYRQRDPARRLVAPGQRSAARLPLGGRRGRTAAAGGAPAHLRVQLRRGGRRHRRAGGRRRRRSPKRSRREAFMIYPALPEGRVGKLDLVRFALRGRRRDLLTILLMGLGGGLLSLLVPIVTGQVFGRVIPDSNRTQLLQLTLALAVGALGAALFQVTRGIAVLRIGGKLDGTLQPAVWDRLLQMPASFFRRFTVGDLVQRSMGIDAIRGALTGNVTSSVLAAVFSVFSFAILFYYSWPLALLATALVAALLLATGTLAWLQLRHQRRLLDLEGKISSLLFGLINGIGKLRVAGAEQRAYALWAERFSEQRQAHRQGPADRQRPGGAQRELPRGERAGDLRRRRCDARGGPGAERLPRLQRRLRPVPGGRPVEHRAGLDSAHFDPDLRAARADPRDPARGRLHQGRSGRARRDRGAESRLLPLRDGRTPDPGRRLLPRPARGAHRPGGPFRARASRPACGCCSASRSPSPARSTTTPRTFPPSTCPRCGARSESCSKAGVRWSATSTRTSSAART